MQFEVCYGKIVYSFDVFLPEERSQTFLERHTIHCFIFLYILLALTAVMFFNFVAKVYFIPGHLTYSKTREVQ